MTGADVKSRLLAFLDEKLFRPLLDLDPQTIEAGERDAFVLLQDEFAGRRDALYACASAEDVRTRFEEEWRSDWAVEARRGLARLGHSIADSTGHDFLALAHKLGLDHPAAPEGIPDIDPGLERRVRERARRLWQEDGSPKGREDEYLERARELEAIAAHPGFGLMPNPLTEAERRPSADQPVEPPEAVENQADVPGPLTDQGERPPAPRREARKEPG